jgi:urease accessory protein
MIPIVTSIRKFIGLLHLASPALPIGAYSYSQGLEGAVDAGLIHEALSVRAWIQSGPEHVLATNELPMLAILYRDWDEGNYSEVKRSNAYFLASRESLKLRQETKQK